MPASLPLAETLTRESSGFQRRTTAHAPETFGAWWEAAHDDLVLAVALALWSGELFCRMPVLPPGSFKSFGQLNRRRIDREPLPFPH